MNDKIEHLDVTAKRTHTLGDLHWQAGTADGWQDLPSPPLATTIAADKWLAEHLADEVELGTYRLIRVVKVCSPQVETRRRVRLA